MSTSRKKPGWAFWTTVAVVGLPLLYVASFGPTCWISSRTGFGAEAAGVFYWPLTWKMRSETLQYLKGDIPHSGRICNALEWYAELGAAEDWCWWFPLGGNEHSPWTWRKVDQPPITRATYSL